MRLLVAGTLLAGLPAVAQVTTARRASALDTDPAALVDPFAGTGTGAVNPGSIGEFPGADLPFGMIQWSPDTTPDRTSGSGYAYGDTRISGFSLTHMSGTGCASYGDVPILPTTGAVGPDPANTSVTFSHRHESAAPGRYAVAVGSPATSVRLSVTTRTGLAQLEFPATAAANVLFDLSGSAGGAQAARVRLVGDDRLVGQVTSGGFCGTGTNYTLYFVARFDRPFATAGTWNGTSVDPGTTACVGAACGAYVTFDARHDRRVAMKVGISFVSTAGAAANLAAEDPGWSLARVEARATARWNALLGRIRIGGGTRTQERIFTTALYHSLLHPNVVSDVGGDYPGEDGQVHHAAAGQYANFSEWDVYRSEIELIALLAPHQASAMVQSLVNDAQQAGWLPKWAIVAGDASQMNGDSADPIIAAAYAFGARDFDLSSALRYMVKGAKEAEPPQGLEIERQYLDQYLAQHYVNAGVLDLDSIDYSVGASMTLEYAIDDFSIAQLAAVTGDAALYHQMMARAHNWEYLFNPATGYLQAREAGGAFPAGPAFNPALFEDGGQRGFEEGNAIQYTWSVPQDLFALGALMGGNAGAVAKLDAFFTRLNATRFAPYDWAGNEPDLWAPFDYDYFGAPWRTQSVVRRIETTLYRDAPVNEPGNDDLGAISSWYVWAALGLYPVTPGTANLALASPLFPTATVTLPDGRSLVIDAPGASAATPFVHALRVGGPRLPASVAACPPSSRVTVHEAEGLWTRPWLPASVLRTGATLTYSLSRHPDPAWGSAPAARPPSYAAGRIPAVGYSTPSGPLDVRVGAGTAHELGVKAIAPGAGPVTWRATATSGLTVVPDHGTLAPSETAAAGSGSGCPSPAASATILRITASAAGTGTVSVDLTSSAGTPLPPVVVTVDATT